VPTWTTKRAVSAARAIVTKNAEGFMSGSFHH
jgi:hypothetical protein